MFYEKLFFTQFGINRNFDGGANVVHAANSSLMEITGEGQQAPVPKVSPLEAGKLDSESRKFDLRCAGKCRITNGDLKLITSGFEKVPDLFAIGDDGNVVYAQPMPMGMIQMPKGRNGWVRVELKTISSKFAEAEKYLCLGIRRRGKNEYLAKLYEENLSKYIGMASEDVVELVPLISTTELPDQYTEAVAGTVVNIAGTEKSFDFSSVYRIETAYFEFASMEKSCDLVDINGNGKWSSQNQIGIGLINGKTNQLVAINENGQLACSSNGLHWENAGSVYESDNGSGWAAGLICGDNKWCAVNISGDVRYFTDQAETWTISKKGVSRNVYSLSYGNGIFMAVTDGGQTHISADAENWDSGGNVGIRVIRILGYGNGKWLCGGDTGGLSTSTDGKTWTSLPSNLSSFVKKWVHGGYYAGGFFYVVEYNGSIVRSSDGEVWNKVADFSCEDHVNVTLFNNMLFATNREGNHCHIAVMYPNGEGIEVI